MTRKMHHIDQPVKAAPLAVFRIFFGLMMCVSIIRFWSKGWIDELYIQPDFFFSYYGFEWVKPLGDYTYLLFFVCGLAALFVALGFKYRLSITTFFLSFTYIELMDKTTYLNHYYFISILSFLMIFLPAAAFFSLDASRNGSQEYVPKWTVDSLKLLIGTVYFYAGLAKLNSDWLIQGMPLKIWLPVKYDLPILGSFFHQEWVIYFFSWSGAIYDLCIPFLLLWKRTRMVAFILVVIFHVLTRVLFPIGMFPYIMIVSALIFFDPAVHERIIALFRKIPLLKKNAGFQRREPTQNAFKTPVWKASIIAAFFVLQIALPWRYLLYPGELFWHEQGYRFSWRVMLMEKAGYAQFKVVTSSGDQFYVDNTEFLSPMQEKQMATQPDFILEYAHYLKRRYEKEGLTDVQIYVDSYVALNGRKSQPFIDPEVNLAALNESFKTKHWILPFNDEIKGI